MFSRLDTRYLTLSLSLSLFQRHVPVVGLDSSDDEIQIAALPRRRNRRTIRRRATRLQEEEPLRQQRPETPDCEYLPVLKPTSGTTNSSSKGPVIDLVSSDEEELIAEGDEKTKIMLASSRQRLTRQALQEVRSIGAGVGT